MFAIDDVSTMTADVRRQASSVAEVLALLRRHGARRYAGEPVSHQTHALQCATLAYAAGAPAPLVAACLLHDIGHLLTDPVASWSRGQAGNTPADEAAAATPTLGGFDDGHERTGAAWLGALFLPSVLQPIRWHVDAKRYLVAADPGYRAALSEDSRRTLALQGGPMRAEEVPRFLARPWAADAIRLRRWDEAAKVPGARALPLETLARELESCVRRG